MHQDRSPKCGKTLPISCVGSRFALSVQCAHARTIGSVGRERRRRSSRKLCLHVCASIPTWSPVWRRCKPHVDWAIGGLEDFGRRHSVFWLPDYTHKHQRLQHQQRDSAPESISQTRHTGPHPASLVWYIRGCHTVQWRFKRHLRLWLRDHKSPLVRPGSAQYALLATVLSICQCSSSSVPTKNRPSSSVPTPSMQEISLPIRPREQRSLHHLLLD